MPLNYDLNKIKFATDEATYQCGADLYERGKVREVEEAFGDYSAVVQGTKPYRVSVSGRRYRNAACNCYLGERGTLCKHVVALALHAVMDGKPLKAGDKDQTVELKCSDRREELNKDRMAELKRSITAAMKYIKPYYGPSRTWFANQDSLREGCGRLRAVISGLSVNRQAADLLVKVLLRLDRKLQVGGVDDSNGTVGGLMREIVGLLEDFTRIDPASIGAFGPLCGKETCFDWEEPLVRIFKKQKKQKQAPGAE